MRAICALLPLEQTRNNESIKDLIQIQLIRFTLGVLLFTYMVCENCVLATNTPKIPRYARIILNINTPNSLNCDRRAHKGGKDLQDLHRDTLQLAVARQSPLPRKR